MASMTSWWLIRRLAKRAVLFGGGGGETIRRELLKQADVQRATS